MATIKIRWKVEELENVLSQFDVERIYRSTTGKTGLYSIIATVPLITEQENYFYDDIAGATDYYYKITHYNTLTLNESAASDPISGDTAQHPALNIVSIEDLKTKFLFGVDLSDDKGTPFPDVLYEQYIRWAVSQLEHIIDIPIIPKIIIDEKHDYYREDFPSYMWLHLKEFPVISIESAKICFPYTNNEINFDNSWLHLQKESGQLQIMPNAGSMNLMVTDSVLGIAPFMNRAARHIPDFFRVSYTAGFEEVPDVLIDAIGKLASFGPLNIAGDLIVGAGIANVSLSLDGLSQSIDTTSSATNSGYGARLLIYRRELQDIVPKLISYYKGPRLMVV